MIRMSGDECDSGRQTPVDNISVSESAPTISLSIDRNSITLDEHQQQPSSPVTLATMTPVSMVNEPRVVYLASDERHKDDPGQTATVLVLQELVTDDVSPGLGFRKNRSGQVMGEEGAAGEEAAWSRAAAGAYYEQHPLTAATSAMLDISHDHPDQHTLYEYYKLPAAAATATEIWPPTSVSATTGTILSTQLKTNGTLTNAELGGAHLADIQGLFLHASHLKREPEDLSHRKVIGQEKRKVVLVSTSDSDLVNNNGAIQIKDEFVRSPGNRSMNAATPSSTSSMMAQDPGNQVEITDNLKVYASGTVFAGSPSPGPAVSYSDYPQTTTYSAARAAFPDAAYALTHYRDWEQSPVYGGALRQAFGDNSDGAAVFVERYVRQSGAYHNKGVIAAAGLTVDLPSPDSGIGADAVTPRDQPPVQQSFEYSEICQQTNATHLLGGESSARSSHSVSPSPSSATRSRPWHDFGRQNDADKIQIPKIYTQCGFKYYLETPISTNQRREDDRVTYINKGQFYGITMEYIPDPDNPLKSQTVKSIVMLMFREEKSPEDEIKAWQFWHGRQHSVKQRILDADTKNSVGFVGCIEEVAHNAIAVYWNPLESSAKLNIAVQCLSTDFSSQKGVKGLPLHIQIDTYEDPRGDGPIFHRGYCQIKVFCDKGAERKTRDEERRAAKRKMAATGRKKIEELYHPPSERSEFYSMADLIKPPVLFTPAEDIDKLTSMELQGFYGHDTDTSSLSNGEVGSTKHGSPFLLHSVASKPGSITTPTLKFHNHFPPDTINDKKDDSLNTDGTVFSPPLKRVKIPSPNERIMLYVRQDNENVYTPLHVVPPSTAGLLNAIANKYKISASSIINLYRKNRKGILAKIDEDMLTYYCNEDAFILELIASDEGENLIDVILTELSIS